MNRLIIYSLFILLVVSCRPEPEFSKEELIRQRVDEKIETLIKIRKTRCKEKLLSEAAETADSILLSEARYFLDTLSRPPRPNKPESPEVIIPNDSLDLEALFAKDSFPKQKTVHSEKNVIKVDTTTILDSLENKLVIDTLDNTDLNSSPPRIPDSLTQISKPKNIDSTGVAPKTKSEAIKRRRN